jgi:hypothetical protein
MPFYPVKAPTMCRLRMSAVAGEKDVRDAADLGVENVDRMLLL